MPAYLQANLPAYLQANLYVLLFILLILTIAIAAILVGPLNYAGLIYTPILEEKVGGAHIRETHIVVDTLNLTHWMGENANTGHNPITSTSIVNTIDRATPILRRKYSNIIYVLKDQDTQHNSSEIRAAYQNAAERNRVVITCAEKYLDTNSTNLTELHSSKGRDDFYMCILAARNRCAVASEDRLRDFAEFRKNIPPFHVIEFAFWRAIPQRDSIRPSSGAYTRLRKPIMVRFAALGLDKV